MVTSSGRKNEEKAGSSIARPMANIFLTNKLLERRRLIEKIDIAFLLRLILGGLFIYSGIFKLQNPDLFRVAIINYGILPAKMTIIASLVFPWIEIAIGILLVTNIFIHYTIFFSISLVSFFIILTIRNSFRGISMDCGCFPESSILNSKNPIILIIRNYIFVFLLMIIGMSEKNNKLKSIKKIRSKPLVIAYLFILSISLSILVIIAGKRINEKAYIYQANRERQIIFEEVKKVGISESDKEEIKGMINNILKADDDRRAALFILMNSIECNTCVDEVMFVENMNKKYGNKIKVVGVVGNIGDTAISDIRNSHKLTFDVIGKKGIRIFYKYPNIKTLKFIINRSGEIVDIDPVTFNIISVQNEYKNKLRNAIDRR